MTREKTTAEEIREKDVLGGFGDGLSNPKPYISPAFVESAAESEEQARGEDEKTNPDT